MNKKYEVSLKHYAFIKILEGTGIGLSSQFVMHGFNLDRKNKRWTLYPNYKPYLNADGTCAHSMNKLKNK